MNTPVPAHRSTEPADPNRLAGLVLGALDGSLYHDIDHRDVVAILAALDAVGHPATNRAARPATHVAIAPRIGDTVYRSGSNPEDLTPGIVTDVEASGHTVAVRWLFAESITGHSVAERAERLILLVPARAELTDYADPTITIVRRSVRRTDGAVRIEPTGLRFHSTAYAETALVAIAMAKRPLSPSWDRDYLGPVSRRLCIESVMQQEFYEIR
ncbi:hypothetical protein [Mycolicibacterium fallax]|uniref:Uncharacterized protein n=1 Tax=Mycolicibacterium fallax TaxID=1793 RepID=A0A1X1RK52_MYCFA|nr:hypothetical protein [Mycolicibacterium fallax]ORV08040.1 hypothetical protein AWC04_02525 [Mycolicibacterium fallax]